MNTATKEMIRVALANDASVAPEISAVILDAISGRLSGSHEECDGSLLLTLGDASSLLGVCRMTFYRLVRDGIIMPVEITPGVFRYRRKDVVAYGNRVSAYKPVARGIPRRSRSGRKRTVPAV